MALILTECHAETYLLGRLEFKPRHVRKGGMSQVYKKLISQNKLCFGLVDNDNIKPSMDSRFDLDLTIKEVGLSFYKHRNQSIYLIKQEPDFENWFFDICNKNKLFEKNSKFKKGAREIKKVTKFSNKIQRDKEFNILIDKIIELENSPFNKIKNFIVSKTESSE